MRRLEVRDVLLEELEDLFVKPDLARRHQDGKQKHDPSVVVGGDEENLRRPHVESSAWFRYDPEGAVHGEPGRRTQDVVKAVLVTQDDGVLLGPGPCVGCNETLTIF